MLQLRNYLCLINNPRSASASAQCNPLHRQLTPSPHYHDPVQIGLSAARHYTLNIVYSIAEGVRRLRARHVPGDGRLRIVTTELVANWILLPALASLTTDAPAIRLAIEADSVSRSLVDDVETLAIRFVRPERGPYVVRKLASIRFALYCRRDTTPDNFIGWSGDDRPAALSRWLAEFQGGRDCVLALNTMAGHVGAARRGLGIAGLPTFLGEREPLLLPLADAPHLLLDAWLVVPEILAGPRSKHVTRWIVDSFKQIQT